MWKRSFRHIFKSIFIAGMLIILSLTPLVSKSDNAEDANHIKVIVKISEIRSLSIDKKFYFRVNVYADGKEIGNYTSSYKMKFVYFIMWPIAYTEDIPFDRDEPLIIEISLYFRYSEKDEWRTCDIGKNGSSVKIFYDVKRGEWTGDDYLNDSNGYGHVSGFEDGNYSENDCELWFDIYQLREGMSFFSTDRLSLWEILNVYRLDPSKNYAVVDNDGDGIPTSWEDKYGYDPLSFDDHKNLDPDQDGLDNVEEWTTSRWQSDPFAKDIFVEVDFMRIGNTELTTKFPKKSQYMVWKAFARRNITLHIDDGCMGGGGEAIPFKGRKETLNSLREMREKYFLHGDPNNWRRGVFRYAIVTCFVAGMAFYIDSFFIGYFAKFAWLPIIYIRGSDYYTSLAGVFMHELGHTLGIYHGNTPGCDNQTTKYPWQKGYKIYENYKSCMNYRYTYYIVDYSDGSHGENDFDDWGRIDLTLINHA